MSARKYYEETGNSCTCVILAPCGFCKALSVEELDAMNGRQAGVSHYDALREFWRKQDNAKPKRERPWWF